MLSDRLDLVLWNSDIGDLMGSGALMGLERGRKDSAVAKSANESACRAMDD